LEPTPHEPTPQAPPPAPPPVRRKGKKGKAKPKVKLVQVEVLEEPSMFDRTFVVAVLLCLVLMPVAGRVALKAVPRLAEAVDQVVEMEIFEPPPPPEEEPEPEPTPPPPKPKPKKVDMEKVAEVVPTDTAPAEEPVEDAKPVFGVSMKSTVDTGQGSFSMKVGNTVMKENDNEDVKPEDVKPLRSVSFQRLETPPKVQRDFRAEYPEGPRADGIEGTVIMKLTISETGKVTAVKIVRGVHPELDAAAKRAAFKFVFKPGMSGGEPVITTNYVYRYTWLIDG
jgi:TonB family protein